MGGTFHEEWVCEWQAVDAIEAALLAAGLMDDEQEIEEGTKRKPAPIMDDGDESDSFRGFFLRLPTPTLQQRADRRRSEMILSFSRTEDGLAEGTLWGSMKRRDSLLPLVEHILSTAGAKRLMARQNSSYTDPGWRNGMKYESVALLSVGAGTLTAGLVRWSQLRFDGANSNDLCWALGLVAIIATWVCLGRRVDDQP